MKRQTNRTGSRELLDDDSISSESDSEEEAEDDDFHQQIQPALLIGQAYTAYWPWTAFLDNAVDEDDIRYDNGDEEGVDGDGLHTTWSGSFLEPYSPHPRALHRDLPSLSPVHRRAPSLPSELQLDDIHISSDQEYGFNPNRQRPMSLFHSSNDNFPFSQSRGSIASLLGSRGEPFRRSHATNEKEAELEAEVQLLRSQPSGVQFMRRCRSDVRATNETGDNKRDGKIGHKRLRAIRRQLSLDSKSRRKTLSDDRDLARLRGKGTGRLSKPDSAVPVPFLRSLSRDDAEVRVAERLESNVSSLSAEVLCSSIVNLESIVQEGTQLCPGIVPPPIFGEKIETEVFLRGETVTGKGLDPKTRRRGAIPGFFGGFKFPNKKAFKKLMRRRQGERGQVNAPMVPLSKVPSPLVEDCSQQPLKGVQAKVPHPLKLQPEELPLSQDSFNSYRRGDKERSSRRGHPMRLLVSCAGVPLTKEIKSCSVRSLPKVEEGFEEEVETSKSLGSLDEDKRVSSTTRTRSGKQIIEFDESFRRKSCSTCSIAVARHLRGSNSRDDVQVLRRRMSDTALALQDRTPGCSPGKRFVRKLLSPVVCGLPVDRYMTFKNDSMLSLASDSTSLASDYDASQQTQLFNFSLQEIAEELSLIDKELLIRISWQELANCSWMAKNKFSVAPNVMNMVDFFNRIAMLIATSVLAEETVYMRAKVIAKVIKLARKCRLINNFNSLKAILGGLQCTPIYRLKATWKQVSSRRKKQLKELTKLMSELDNFKRYRAELGRCLEDEISCLPFLGDFLTQLAQTHAYVAVRRKFLNTAHRTSIPRADSPLPSLAEPQKKSEKPKTEDQVPPNDSERLTVVETKAIVHSGRSCGTTDDEANVKCSTTDDETNIKCSASDRRTECVSSPGKPSFLRVRHLPSASSSKRTHARNDSDDSGVVIDTNRLSRGSEDLDASRDNLNMTNTSDYDRCSDGLSSPEAEEKTLDLFMPDQESEEKLFIESKTDSNCKSESSGENAAAVATSDESNATESTKGVVNNESKMGKSASKKSTLDSSEHSNNTVESAGTERNSSASTDKKEDQRKTNENGRNEKWCDYVTEEFAKETKELEDNLRKRRLFPQDEKYQKELEFWRYQIIAIQYRFPPRPHVRRFLLNHAYKSEEENYRLSLLREPPEKAQS